MGIQTAGTLYPRNANTVDTGGAIDIRRLETTNSNTGEPNSVNASHAQDNVERTFDPAATSSTAVLDCRTLQKLGWALRLTEDMTPTDDTNCNAYLPAGTFTIGMRFQVTASGGTGFVGGTYAPLLRAALFSYDPSADTGTLIAEGSSSATSWNTAAGGDSGTSKNCTFTINLASGYEFPQGTVLLIQFGMNTQTMHNPLSGTTAYSFALRTDSNNTYIMWAAGQSIKTLCGCTGSADGVATVSGSAATVLATEGAATGVGSAAGVGGATAETTGAAAGVATAAAEATSVGGGVGAAAGSSEVSGAAAIVLGTVGTVEVGGEGGATVVKHPIYLFDD